MFWCSTMMRSILSQIFALFIHSFILAISIAPLQVHYYSEALPATAWILYRRVSHRGAQATASKGLAQGPYVAARVGVEPTTLRLKVIDSTNAPPRPTLFIDIWQVDGR